MGRNALVEGGTKHRSPLFLRDLAKGIEKHCESGVDAIARTLGLDLGSTTALCSGRCCRRCRSCSCIIVAEKGGLRGGGRGDSGGRKGEREWMVRKRDSGSSSGGSRGLHDTELFLLHFLDAMKDIEDLLGGLVVLLLSEGAFLGDEGGRSDTKRCRDQGTTRSIVVVVAVVGTRKGLLLEFSFLVEDFGFGDDLNGLRDGGNVGKFCL